jgi:hypothetical protein
VKPVYPVSQIEGCHSVLSDHITITLCLGDVNKLCHLLMRPYEDHRVAIGGKSKKILLNIGTTTLNTVAFRIMIISIGALSIMTLNIMTLSKTTFKTVMLSVFYTDSLLYRGSHKPIMVSVIMLNVR